MSKGKSRQLVVQNAAADGIVVSSLVALVEHFFALCCDPSHTQAGHGEDLGHASYGNTLVIEVYDGLHVASVLRNPSVHLVTEHVSVHALRNLDDFLHDVYRNPGTCRVVRIVDGDHLGILVNQASEHVQVWQKIVL